MLILAFALIGAALGYTRAAKRGGNGKDRLHWAVIWAMIGLLIGLFITLILMRI